GGEGQEAGGAGHLPNLAEHALSGFEQREIDIGPDVEDADFERCSRVGVPEKCSDLLLLACIERGPDRTSACRFDLGDKRRQFLALPASGKNGEPFGRKLLSNGSADEVAGPNYRARFPPSFHSTPPPPPHSFPS